MNASDVQDRIKAEFKDASITVSGADCSFSVQVVTQAFKDLRPVLRQQKILQLFSAELSTGELHALTVEAKTPAEATTSSGGLTSLTV